MPRKVHPPEDRAPEKPVKWMGSAKEDLSAFPDTVKRLMGFALRLAQRGGIHEQASLMRGDLRGVVEIRDQDPSGAYRTMYTIKLGNSVYVLHAFQKKSTQGIATPQKDLTLIKKRFKDAHDDYKQELRQHKDKGL